MSAIAAKDRESAYFAGHAADSKRASSSHVVEQFPCNFKKMGHSGNVVAHMDQKASVVDLFKAVAKGR